MKFKWLLVLVLFLPTLTSHAQEEKLLKAIQAKVQGIRFYRARVNLGYFLDQAVSYQDVIEYGEGKVFVQRMLCTEKGTKLLVASLIEDEGSLKKLGSGGLRLIDKEKMQDILGEEVSFLNWLKPFAYNGLLADPNKVLAFRVERADTFLYVFELKATFLDVPTVKRYEGIARYFFDSESGILRKVEFYDKGGKLLLRMELTDLTVLDRKPENLEVMKEPEGAEVKDLTALFLDLLR